MSAPNTVRAQRQPEPRLAVRFGLTVAIGLVVTGAAIVLVVRPFFVRAQESQATAHAQLVSSVILDGVLRPTDFGHPSANRIKQLERLFRAHVFSASTVAGELYRRDGTVAFSTDAATIGRRTPASTTAIAAATSPRLSTRVTRIRIDGRMRKVLEDIVPVRFDSGPATGVIVLSTDYSAITGAAARSYLPISVALELLLAVLFLALVPTVRRAILQTRRHVKDAQLDALRDTLTGLPNRRLFDDRIEHTLAHAQRHDSTAAVMLIDLDRFKEINDTLGHAAGDVLLRETAVRLVEVLRDSDTVARIGGDEFAVILSDGAPATVHETAKRMHAAIERPVEHDGLSLSVGASIGVSLYPQHGKTAVALQRCADIAMYQAKRAGLGHVVFDPGTTTGYDNNLALSADLTVALDRREFVLHYQPTVALHSGEVAGVEALLRWNHPVQGLLSADRFTALADQAGVRAQVYDFALVEAIRQAGQWRREGITLSVAINLDARTLIDRDLPRRVERLLDEHGVEPQQIEAEIAEASLLGDVDRVSAVAIELAALGVILVVDDFGADHSSLNTLAYLPIEKLKIGRTLLARAVESRRDEIVLAGVIELAHNLSLEVVVAGVEDESTLALVRHVGADYGQGYHLGAPVDATAIERLVPAVAA